MTDERDSFTSNANRSLQENLDRGEPVIFASYSFIGAILLFGCAGYLVDRWLHTSPWGLLSGGLVGLAVAFYAVVNALRRG